MARSGVFDDLIAEARFWKPDFGRLRVCMLKALENCVRLS